VRLLITTCQVEYSGRLSAQLPLAKRLVMVKLDGSVSIHSDGGAYKPLNWMVAPCSVAVEDNPGHGWEQVWTVTNRGSDVLKISLQSIEFDQDFDLGTDPGLEKDGVEAHLQELLAERPQYLESGLNLIQREYPTAIGPVDLLCRSDDGRYIAVEIKRRAGIDGVEQLSRYLDILRRDPLMGQVDGILAAQSIKPQARILAQDRGIECVGLDYDELRGITPDDNRLF